MLIAVLCFGSLVAIRASSDNDEVAGPVVKLEDVHTSGEVHVSPLPEANATGPGEAVAVGAEPPPSTAETLQDIATAVQDRVKEVAREVDKTLIKVGGARRRLGCLCPGQICLSISCAAPRGPRTACMQEFGNGTSGEKEGTSFAAALSSAQDGSEGESAGKLETVVRISGSTGAEEKDKPASKSSTSSSGGAGNKTASSPEREDMAMEAIEKSVDRIIDQHDNEFVLSKPGSEMPALTLDPQVSAWPWQGPPCKRLLLPLFLTLSPPSSPPHISSSPT